VELAPETGRTHQLRVHMASLGHPIVDDRLYAEPFTQETTSRLEGSAMNPIALHATSLRLPHPRDGREVEFVSPLPANFGRAGIGRNQA
jgi:23S rRNA-/tRNA-specific pseudouridylate synthase